MPGPEDNKPQADQLDSAILSVLLDAVPDMIYFKDLESRYVRINRAHADLLGLADPVLAIGRTVSDFVSEAHAAESLKEERQIVATGEALEGKEEIVTLKSGREIWVSTSKLPWRSDDGRIMGTVGIIRDIDEAKRAQKQLDAKQSLVRTLIDHLPSRIFAKDADGMFIMNNRVHLESLGVKSQADTIGHHTLDFFPSDRGLQAKADDEQVIGRGLPIIDQEKSDFGPEGSTRWSLTTKVPFKDPGGKIIGLVGISHDITLRKRTEQELRRRTTEMETDLRMACQLQHAFFPQEYPVFPEGADPEKSIFKFAQRYLPAATLGGDFYDVIRVSDHEVGVLICDVMGHGVRAGLITALIRGLVEELSSAAGNPARMLGEINRGLAPFLSQTGLPVFASVFYAVADSKAGTLRFANAGHPGPYVLRRATKTVDVLTCENPEPAAGLDLDFAFTEWCVAFGPGDGLFLFSDGLFEASNAEGESFGEDSLRVLAQASCGLAGDAFIEAAIEGVRAHVGAIAFDDDICALLLDRSSE